MLQDHQAKSYAYSLITVAFSVLLGVCLLHLQPELQRSVWTGAELLMFLPVCLWFFYRRAHGRAVMAFFAGYLWALLFAHSYLNQQLSDELAGSTLLLEGQVSGVVARSEQSIRFNFEVQTCISEQNSAESTNRQKAILCRLFKPSLVRLSWYYNDQMLRTGERWRLKVRLKQAHGMQNPGGFDYEKWLYQQGVHATGYVYQVKGASTENLRIAAASPSMDGLREHLIQLISTLPDRRFQGLLQALTVGYKSQISAEQWQLMRNTGTSHLMAISGLHIGLIAGLVFFLVRWLTPVQILKGVSAQQVAALISLAAALFYALLAGFTVPTQRAFIMLLVIMLAILFKRPAFGANTLALALLGVILTNPVAVLSAGFWLSFLAVMIISLVSSARLRYTHSGQADAAFIRAKNSADRWLQGLRIQWLIALGMLPLSVLLFQQGSVISPVANMLVIPLVGFLVVPLVLLASFISMVSTEAALWVFMLASDVMALIWYILQWLGESPVASWKSASIPLLHGFLALAGVFLLLMPRGFPLRFAGIILLMPMLLYEADRPPRGDLWVTVLDVGQGLSVVLQTHEKTLLYDTGARFGERFDMGEKTILPYLQFTGVEQLDTLLVSHGDNDHAGGAQAILKQMKVLNILAGDGAVQASDSGNSYVSICRSGQHWHWDGVDFEILHPARHYKKANNRSCVLKVSGKNYSLLLSGDIEAKAERKLLKSAGAADKLQADVLVVPHHGSNTSSSAAFLRSIKPRLAIVSAGYRNRFGHPTNQVLQRYSAQGVEVLNTAYEGAIQVKFSKTEENRHLQISKQRKSRIHYWNHRL